MVEINWLIFSFVSAIMFSGMTLLFKYVVGKGVSPSLGLFYILLIATISVGSYSLLIQKISFALTMNLAIVLIVAGMCSFIGNLMLFSAIGIAPNPGYATAISTLQVLIITIVSLFIFNIESNLWGILGALLTVMGVSLIAIMG